MIEKVSGLDTGRKITLTDAIDGVAFNGIDFSGWIRERHTYPEWAQLGAKNFLKSFLLVAFSPFENKFSIQDTDPVEWSQYVHTIQKIVQEYHDHKWEDAVVKYMRKIGFSKEEIAHGTYAFLSEHTEYSPQETRKVKQAFAIALRRISKNVM